MGVTPSSRESVTAFGLSLVRRKGGWRRLLEGRRTARASLVWPVSSAEPTLAWRARRSIAPRRALLWTTMAARRKLRNRPQKCKTLMPCNAHFQQLLLNTGRAKTIGKALYRSFCAFQSIRSQSDVSVDRRKGLRLPDRVVEG